ncbi:glycosyltransferase family 2 protein [Ornithinimicrobium sp. Y1847]|uniref:glycosyltransferase family 2 protein n=1 Tax=Ornithinimicrobium sp. Y1847 TaxID=3405419 RepID=UPI003B67830F
MTVAIATRGRPELLETALASVLCQTVQDFEVVVVEDGPVDDRTRLVVESFGDERLKYVPQDWAGISAARNRALDMSTGRFTAVMDDDDIMPPWRLEASLGSIRAGEHGCVGSFVTFSDLSGELVSWQDPFPTLLGASMRGGFAGHPTWMVRTDVLRAFRYDESFSSAVDNNLALRMVRSGIKLRHSGEVLNVRRVHEGQVTALDSAFQGRGAKLNARWLSAGLTPHEIQENVKSGRESQMARKPSQADHDAVVALLPDSLVTRRTVLIATQEAEARKWRERAGVREIVEANFDGVFFAQITVDGLTWRELADVQRSPNLHITKWGVRAEDSKESPELGDSVDPLWRSIFDHVSASMELTDGGVWCVYIETFHPDGEMGQNQVTMRIAPREIGA